MYPLLRLELGLISLRTENCEFNKLFGGCEHILGMSLEVLLPAIDTSLSYLGSRTTVICMLFPVIVAVVPTGHSVVYVFHHNFSSFLTVYVRLYSRTKDGVDQSLLECVTHSTSGYRRRILMPA